ncbi:hypothetical protein SKAU_G00111630 [Synaphobranchus kaupii]|uniref:Uncharacterized protein n=1 Tax=Synaphobranchus kaupii TaxID=118154 RepID=A0A9Q1G0I3_SYNKA|nr:hypothetical protein SKAU_G00111630 [Synaphobranchus kaupii]
MARRMSERRLTGEGWRRASAVQSPAGGEGPGSRARPAAEKKTSTCSSESDNDATPSEHGSRAGRTDPKTPNSFCLAKKKRRSLGEISATPHRGQEKQECHKSHVAVGQLVTRFLAERVDDSSLIHTACSQLPRSRVLASSLKDRAVHRCSKFNPAVTHSACPQKGYIPLGRPCPSDYQRGQKSLSVKYSSVRILIPKPLPHLLPMFQSTPSDTPLDPTFHSQSGSPTPLDPTFHSQSGRSAAVSPIH